MNRIILIGNGFDLAHGLPTSYGDFINQYWDDFGYHILNGYARWMSEEFDTTNIKPYTDNIACLEIIIKKNADLMHLPVCNNEQNSYSNLCKFINDYNHVERFSDAIFRINPSKIASVWSMVSWLLLRVFSNHALYSLFSIVFSFLYLQN